MAQKENYEEIKIELIMFAPIDLITTSGGENNTPSTDDNELGEWDKQSW